MDVWSAFRRYMAVVSVVVLFSILGFGMLGMLKVKDLFKNAYTNNHYDVWISSSSYYIEPSVGGEMVSRGSMDYFRLAPDDFEALLNTDSCMEYIYNRITSIYSKEDIIKNSRLGREDESIKPSEFNALSVKKLYSAERLENTMLVNLSSYSYDENLSDDILKACEDYLSENVIPNLDNIEVKYTGGSKKTLSPSQLAASLSNTDSDISKSLVSPNINYTRAIIVSLIKNVIIPVMLVAALCLGVLFLIALFNPTLNRKSDFYEYDVPVIGEINNKGKLKEME